MHVYNKCLIFFLEPISLDIFLQIIFYHNDDENREYEIEEFINYANKQYFFK